MTARCLLVALLVAIGNCAIPTSRTGPGGSRFTLIDAWKDANLVAFVDVNSDRRTDAVVYAAKKQNFDVLMAPGAKARAGAVPSRQDLFRVTQSGVKAVIPGDFDGDSIVDYLTVFAKNGGGYSVDVRYGKAKATQHVVDFTHQPLVCDVNADMIADVYGEVASGSRKVLLGAGDGFREHSYTTSTDKWSTQHHAGFATLGHDANPSIVVLTESGKLEVYKDLVSPDSAAPVTKNPTMTIELPKVMRDAATNGIMGKFVFGDFNMSGNIQLLMMGCGTKDCKTENRGIYVCSFMGSGSCAAVEVDLSIDDYKEKGLWTLAPTPASELALSSLIGPSLGDVDLDGFPDLAVGLTFHPANGNPPVTVPAVLRNMWKVEKKLGFKAFLLPGVKPPVDESDELLQIAFFDYNEDGVLDLFFSYHSKSPDEVITALYEQKLASDAYFLKVMLTTGRCGSPGQCPGGMLPYGLPGYGFRAGYETQGSDGGRITSSGTFVSTSCCGALQLPFVVFGFGDFATYIESVPVSVPAPQGQSVRRHELTFIVPNAQVVVIPYPPDVPYDWQAKLFLEPLYDMKVIYVAITLVVTCVALIVVIGVLQCLEMKSDQKEMLQESQRFHFDAM